MDHTEKNYLVFSIDGQLFGVPAGSVHHVVRAAALTMVPNAPSGLMGVLNLHGRLIPVFDIRPELGKKARDLKASDRFIIIICKRGLVAFVADDVTGLIRTPESDQVSRHEILSDICGGFSGIIAINGDAILTCEQTDLIPDDLAEKLVEAAESLE